MTPKYSEDASKKLISFQKTALLVVTPLAVEMSSDTINGIADIFLSKSYLSHSGI
jgi:hypothetical protein